MIFKFLARTPGELRSDDAELPGLRLALAGFTREQQALLAQALAAHRGALRWELVAPAQADALCAHGGRTRSHPDGSLEILPGAPGDAALRFDPRQADRPLAFSLPFALAGYEQADTFDLASPFTLRRALEKFEGWLRPQMLQFCLAEHLVQERLDVGQHVWHVSAQGRLIAVISSRGGVAVLPIADPAQVAGATWARRPALAGEIPSHFERAPLATVLWKYALRSRRDLLPASWRSGPLYWRRAPAVPQPLWRDSQLAIVRELLLGPTSFAILVQRTGLAEAELARGLAALAVVGAITNDRRQASPAAGRRRPPGPPDPDLTAPVPLMPLHD